MHLSPNTIFIPRNAWKLGQIINDPLNSLIFPDSDQFFKFSMTSTMLLGHFLTVADFPDLAGTLYYTCLFGSSGSLELSQKVSTGESNFGNFDAIFIDLD